MDDDNKFKISKNSGHGTTHKIRNALNFTDSKKWKKFSSRRLALIDHFGLSERKASEQDDNIKQIANILRSEFNYPWGSTSDFEKLVTAAVQSVRRNRKRSKKKTLSRINSSTDTNKSITTSSSTIRFNNTIQSSTSTSSSISSMDYSKPTPNKIATLLIGNNNNNSLSSSSASSSDNDDSNENMIHSASTTFSPVFSPSQLIAKTNSSVGTNNTFILPKQPLNHRLGSTSNSMVTLPLPTISNSSSSLTNNNNNNNIHEPIKSMLRALIKINLSEHIKNGFDQSRIPFNLKQNLLSNIQQSTSLLSTIESYDSQNAQQFANLETLGQTSIRASISLVIERYFVMTLKDSLLGMLRVKSSSQDYIDKITENLFNDIVIDILQSIDPILLQSSIQPVSNKIKIFNLIIGSLVKDFGFDSVLSPLNDIIQILIKLEYQDIQNNNNNNNLNGLNMLSSVSLQVNETPAPAQAPAPISSLLSTSPQPTITNGTTMEKLPSVALFDDIIKRISTKNDAPKINSIKPLNILPKTNLSMKSSFENGNLPQPIHQF
ncbi:similar to Saccharomyces cerevisiae YIL056W VHR1 Transcriptional activator [Maudiozyma barnettii]|uniref:Similar to Saccharomyces cerevisiae YIL056W VHR1 Transcriptional activator n=1 Tax=Maudiozyma barnettii TaxID=61262 RepID=A0A8H2ZJ93_9SACH|nr:uncharacterized protein KABA2_03S10604 [Kazachstania barnettii]CAB4254017.1 similar to Saccharomyces cerevisiae YIL056W VHR1 Transcriptional activator [Kazachstania barnettii]CAD1781767.1 similar to Saccharomyces cerevisiae YIL056W VHR1 Transcriptional activator [Kazachstania barnettii]